MTDTKQITILSGLPVATLDYLRLALNIAYVTDPAGNEKCAAICRLVNLALEEKQLNYYSSYEELDDNQTTPSPASGFGPKQGRKKTKDTTNTKN